MENSSKETKKMGIKGRAFYLGLLLVGVAVWAQASVYLGAAMGLSFLPKSVYVVLPLLGIIGKILETTTPYAQDLKAWLIASTLADVVILLKTFSPGGLGILYFPAMLLSLYGLLRYLETPASVLPVGWLRYLPFRLGPWLFVVMFARFPMRGSSLEIIIQLASFLYVLALGGLPLMIAYRRLCPESENWAWARWWDEVKSGRLITGDNASIEKAVEGLRKNDKCFEAIEKAGGYTTLLSLVAWMTLGTLEIGDDSIVMLGFFLMCLGILAWCIGAWGNLEDSRYEALLQMHRSLRVGVDHRCQFRYRVELRSFDQVPYFERAERFGKLIGTPRGFDSWYSAEALRGEVDLSNGAHLRFVLGKKLKKKTEYVRSSGGRSSSTTIRDYSYADFYQVAIILPEGMIPHSELPKIPKDMTIDRTTLKHQVEGSTLYLTAGEASSPAEVSTSGLLAFIDYAFSMTPLDRPGSV